VALCVTSRAVPVKFHNCNDSVTRIVGKLWVPTEHSRDILQQVKGIILVESIQILWFLRWSGGGGWSGRAVAQLRPRVSKLRWKKLSDYHFNVTAVKEARQGASGPKKRSTLPTCILKKGELGNSFKLDWKGPKIARQMKRTTEKKRRIAYSYSRWRYRWDKWRRWRWWWVRSSRANHKSMWQHFGVLMVNPNPCGWGRIWLPKL
jgi:hypothetical protein